MEKHLITLIFLMKVEKQNFDYGPKKLGHRHSLYRINEQIRTVVTQINESIRF